MTPLTCRELDLFDDDDSALASVVGAHNLKNTSANRSVEQRGSEGNGTTGSTQRRLAAGDAAEDPDTAWYYRKSFTKWVLASLVLVYLLSNVHELS